jgi:hypothetical protein
VVVVAALAGCSFGSEDDSRQERIFELATYSHAQYFTATALRAVDPKTLLPAGRPLQLGDSVTSRLLSPDRRALAFGGHNFGEIIFVDPATMRRRAVPLTKSPDRVVVLLSWPRRNLLIAESCRNAGKLGCFDERLWLVDPMSPRRRRSIPVPGISDSAYDPRTGMTIALIAGYRGGIRASRLLVADRHGRVRRIGLPPVPGGVDARRRAEAHYVRPSLALDSRRGLAVVVGPRSPVAEVDLRTLRVRYRRVPGLDPTEAAIARDRPREWTGTQNPHSESAREASLLESGRMLVHIGESRLANRYAVRELARTVVLDTRRWRVRELRPLEAGTRVGDLTLVNTRPQDKAFPPFRLAAYDRQGKLRYRLDGAPRRLFTWQLGAGLLYAGDTGGSMTHVFDVATGKLVRRIPPRELDFEVEPAAIRWTAPAE